MEYSPDISELSQYTIEKTLHAFRNTVRDLIKLIECCVPEIITIADELDKFHRGATIASVTGSSFGIAGGITTIVGLALIPVTLGASLIVTGVGIGVAVAGGLTGASASIADTVNIKKKCNKVKEMVDKINEKMESLKVISDNINLEVVSMQNAERLFNARRGRFDLPSKNINLNTLNMQTGKPNAEKVIDARLGKCILYSVQIGRVIELSKISTVASRGAQLAARGIQAAAAVSGILVAVFILVDAFFVYKGAKDLHNGSKTEEAKKIREQAEELKNICEDLKEVNNLSSTE